MLSHLDSQGIVVIGVEQDLYCFAFFHQVFAALVGLIVFAEVLRANVMLGAAIILAAGIFALWRASRRAEGD
jgi:drug/metabolite transporter (DMT)-like permease